MEDRKRLIQEDHIARPEGPWRVLVICQCLNLASWPVAERVVTGIFDKYGKPERFSGVATEDHPVWRDLYERMRCLGFGRRRAWNLVRMSREYVRFKGAYGDRFDQYPVRELAGCGAYAADAWALFVLGTACDPDDKHLRRYAERVGLLKGVDDEVSEANGHGGGGVHGRHEAVGGDREGVLQVGGKDHAELGV